MTIAKPTQVATPFANSGLKNSIPQSATGSNLASLEEGFPAVTMAAVADGGTPPQGQDFNGVLYQVTNQLRYAQAGGLYPYDSTFCTAIGGYPLGAILMSADGSKVWQNQVAGNTNNPDLDSTNWLQITDNASLDTALAAKLSLSGGEMTGAILSSANVGVEVSRDSEGTWGCSAIRTDTGNNIAFGIGGDGDNRGIFDNSLNNWLINRNSTGALQSGGADVILSTGGTMTGTLKFNEYDDWTAFILNKDDKAVLGHSVNNNQIFLSSPDGETYLRVGNDKSLKWAAKEVERVSEGSLSSTGSGYIRYESGLQICWSYQPLNRSIGANTYNTFTWTYPKSFESTWSVFANPRHDRFNAGANNASKTSATMYYTNISATTYTIPGVDMLVIGSWK